MNAKKNKPKNKILYLIHVPPPVHGVSYISQQVYRSSLINKGFHTKHIRLNLSSRIQELRKLSLFKVLRLIKIFSTLLFNLITYNPTIVYFTIIPVGKGFWKDAILVFLIKLFRTRIIFHLHNRGINNFYNKPFYNSTYNLVFRNCSIIHLSDKLIQIELFEIFKHNVQLYSCPNGIPEICSNIHANASKSIRILFYSNLFLYKGINTLLQCSTLLLERKIDFKLIIGGEQTQEFSSLFNHFANSNPKVIEYIEVNKTTSGKDKERLFAESDIFIFPSEFSEECMPLVILEAMSVNLPIIASEIGAIDEMVKDEINGYLIRPKDSETLANKIEFLSNNPDLRNEMGKNSKKLFLEKFTIHHHENRMREIFLENLGCSE